MDAHIEFIGRQKERDLLKITKAHLLIQLCTL
jgi:hypothetical protein